MAYDYQTLQGDGLWYWVTIRKVAWFIDHMICSLMTNKYLQFHKFYGHQTRQGTNSQKTPSLLVKSCIFDFFSTSELFLPSYIGPL